MSKNTTFILVLLGLLYCSSMGCLNKAFSSDRIFENESNVQSLIAEQTGMIVTLQ